MPSHPPACCLQAADTTQTPKAKLRACMSHLSESWGERKRATAKVSVDHRVEPVMGAMYAAPECPTSSQLGVTTLGALSASCLQCLGSLFCTRSPPPCYHPPTSHGRKLRLADLYKFCKVTEPMSVGTETQTCFLGWSLPQPGRLGTLALVNPQVNLSMCLRLWSPTKNLRSREANQLAGVGSPVQSLCLPNKLTGLSNRGQDFPESYRLLPLALEGVESFSPDPALL